MHKGILRSQILLLTLAFWLAASASVGIPGLIWPTSAAPAMQGDDHFGVNWINPPGELASPQRMQYAADLGARWDRFTFDWREIQPTAGGPFNFAYPDKAVTQDIANGFKIQGILLGVPGWTVVGGRLSLDAWQRYVTETVSHFKGRVRHWEIWNEPDLLNADGTGFFWYWSAADYYALLKTGYKAIKAADPEAQVLMGSLAFPDNNPDFFPKVLDEMSKDATAKQNNYYFDILPLHMYGRPGTLFDLPVGYAGRPNFIGFHNLMHNYGFDKPIWFNEAGVGIWNTGTGVEGPGRATMDEHASYIIEAFAYGLAGGVDKVFIFQLYDDGAGASAAGGGSRAEYYGLVSNDGVRRPGYAAYQTAAKYFANAKLVTRVNLNRNGSGDVKGIDIITMYGTPNGKVTTLWNGDGSPNQQVRLVADTSHAIRVNKLGQQEQITAVDGAYTIGLAPATNHSNYGCYQGSCNPNDFMIGGDPVILVEPDFRVPATTVRPLPSGVDSPFTVNWATTSPATGSITYDVQYMDAAEGAWRDWITGTTASSAQFGTGSTFAQLNHTYVFRSRARDSAGNLLGGYDYPSNGMASTIVQGGNVVANPPPLPPPPPPVSRGPSEIDAKIEIVWPHDSKPVAEATRANIGAYVFARKSLTSVNSAFNRPVKLYRARNNDPEEEVALGKKSTIVQGVLKFPVFEFNDVDVSQARDPANKYFFRAVVEGADSFGNIWSHGADARTYFPRTDTPTGILGEVPSAIDAKIEIVWPHDNLPVEKATRANIGVYLFQHGTLKSVPADYNQPVRLWRTLNNEIDQEVALGQKVMKSENGLTFPVWQFNDVDVSAARDGLSKYYFHVTVTGARTYSNVWSHSKDPRTYFPKADQPTGILP